MNELDYRVAIEALENHVAQTRPIYETSKAIDYLKKAHKEALANHIENNLTMVAQPEQRNASEHLEPVAWMHPSGGVLRRRSTGLERENWTIPLYTTPPQRKPLSEAAIEGLAKFVAIDDFNYDFARAIEKAHGIKE